MKKTNNHEFHIVNPSPWPLLTSLSLLSITLGTIIWLNNKSPLFLLMGFINLNLCITQWWRDTLRESTMQGCHSKKVQAGITMGMILFIISEIMFFISIFWALFHLSSFPSMYNSNSWPPLGMNLFNPMSLPLLNTMILISSGFFLSWSQYSMMMKNNKMTMLTMYITIILGINFTMIQLYEYYSAQFTMQDSAFGSIFFFSTGFHGIHIMVGTTMLISSIMMIKKNHESKNHMTMFNFSSWYWHFVDVVWIFLYISLYWWPWK